MSKPGGGRVVGPEWLTRDDLAAARGIRPQSVSQLLHRARLRKAETGAWPARGIPEPDATSPVLAWRRSRRDVRAYVSRPTSGVGSRGKRLC